MVHILATIRLNLSENIRKVDRLSRFDADVLGGIKGVRYLFPGTAFHGDNGRDSEPDRKALP
jgi:hypothetical protein